MQDNDVDTREIEDLAQLVKSPGFARFALHVEQEWGAEACIRKIDRVLQELRPGDEDGERSTVLQIRAAARQIQALVSWPEQRIAMLKAEKPKPLARAMDGLRRITR